MRQWFWLGMCCALMACKDPVAEEFVSVQGELHGADKIDAGSRASVIIEEIGPADRAALRVSEISLAAKPSPLPFALSYQPSELAKGHRYNVRARIEDANGRLTWTTDQAYAIPAENQRLILTLRPVTRAKAERRTAFECEGEPLQARFNDQGAELNFRGETWQLTRVRSASGGHYQSSEVDFWTKGNAASMKLGEKSIHCLLTAQ